MKEFLKAMIFACAIISMLATPTASCADSLAQDPLDIKFAQIESSLKKYAKAETSLQNALVLKSIYKKIIKAKKTGRKSDYQRTLDLVEKAISKFASHKKRSHHCFGLLVDLRIFLCRCCGNDPALPEISSSSSSETLPCDCTECPEVFVITSVPFTISEPGKYCVANDLTFTGAGNAITIEASNVTINFANHTLTLTNPVAIGIFADGVEEITLLNDKIISTTPAILPISAAIRFASVRKATLDNIFTENTYIGVDLIGSTDISILNSHFKNHVAADGAAAINAASSGNIRVDNSVIEGSSGIADVFTAGFAVYGGSVNSEITNSKFLNTDCGIYAGLIDGLLIDSCEVLMSPTTLFSAVQIGDSVDSNAANVVIQNSTFSNPNAAPEADVIFLVVGSGCLINSCVIDSNTTESDDFTPAAVHIGCSVINDCEEGLIFTDVIINNTIISGANDIGFFIENASNVVFDNGQVTDSVLANALLVQSNECVVKNSLFSRSINQSPSPLDGTGIFVASDCINCSLLNNVCNSNINGIIVQIGATNTHVQGNNAFDNSAFGIQNLAGSTETYFNTACNNGTDCVGVFPSQQPGDSPAVAGSNICCQPEPI